MGGLGEKQGGGQVAGSVSTIQHAKSASTAFVYIDDREMTTGQPFAFTMIDIMSVQSSSLLWKTNDNISLQF
jgi:hypothetical protein